MVPITVVVFLAGLIISLPFIVPRMLIDVIDHLLGLNPTDHEGWLYYGTLLIRSKDYERAHFALSEAIKLRPDIGEAWRKLGDLFILMEMPTEAEEAYAHAFDADLSKF
ncbi:MAG: tetratricopeptide repeat protein [Candidatus Thorarchaeota archaeon]|jgi:uncharacterized protein HemY